MEFYKTKVSILFDTLINPKNKFKNTENLIDIEKLLTERHKDFFQLKTTTAKFSSVFSSRNQYFFETLHVKLISTLLFHKIIILFQIFYIHFKLSSSPFLQWAKSSKTIPFSNNSAKESTVKFTRQFT